MRNFTSLAIIVLATAACSTAQQKQANAPGPINSASLPGTSAPVQSASSPATATNSPYASTPWRDPNNVLSRRSVYFDFDSSTVGTDYEAPLQAQGKFLALSRDIRIRVEGNADERGSREYNMALGQRRAKEVRKVLEVYGLNESRAEAISYGEDKPAASGHDESSWAKNRRADIKYPGE